MQRGTKATLVFLHGDGEALWLGGTVQAENTYSCVLKVTAQIWESQKRISVNANHNYQQLPQYFDLVLFQK